MSARQYFLGNGQWWRFWTTDSGFVGGALACLFGLGVGLGLGLVLTFFTLTSVSAP